jgi:hypothetical protein
LNTRSNEATAAAAAAMDARYVKVASRFFLAGNGNAGDGCGGGHHHFLDACFLCKRDITPGRHIFMYK